ncbi:uncharacterized protein B0I36DRAFT_386988 [Microdochium trichocladiopsis]|uniref:Zn(2)-C6 fungal-type domain-containing protein n=1 Tax=Microdochium trichocladiopsis TaxID=1682393 RepID=A0A9P8XZ99_9PEZI|nr:uncharacterized protein B0I36DRAFT_386988 [Microdochium trichocladiopsis]KAH7024403.1 hypothetical protein B0I36DRAFT_386988 [Microdochium trichocladiopsis]
MQPSVRRYKSKAQRPCDFCRQRRAACRIVEAAPCELCKAYRRDCTFVHAPPPRRRVPGPDGAGEPARISPGITGPGPVRGTAAATAANLAGTESHNLVTNMQGPPVLSHDMGAAFESLDRYQHAVASHQTQGALDSDLEGYQFEPLYDFLTSGPVEAHGGLPHLGELDNTQSTREELGPQAANISPGIWPGSPPAVADVDHGVLIGPTDPMDPHVMREYYYDGLGQMPFKRLTVRSVVGGTDPVQFLITHDSARELSLRHEERRAELSTIIAPDVGARLLSLYYRFISPQFPILAFEPQPTIEDLSPDVLAAVYLLSLDFSTFDDVLCIQTVYEEQHRRELRDFAMVCLREQESRPTLSSVQCALLLLLAPPDDYLMPNNERASILASMMVSMSNALGLQYDPAGWNLSAADKALRRRISCLVLMSDVWVAAVTGRPLLISLDNWLVDRLSVEDLESSGNDAHKMQDVVRLVELSNILRCILRDLFSLQNSQRLSTNLPDTLRVAQPLMEQITEWYSHTIANKDTGLRDARDKTSSFLELGYHITRAIIFRAIMRPLHNGTLHHNHDVPMNGTTMIPAGSAEQNGSMRVDGGNGGKEQVRIGAMACARAFTAYIEGLSLDDFQSFWPFWSIAGFAFHSQLWLTLLLLAPTPAEAAECYTWNSRVRELLRTRARSFAPLRLALLRADSIWWRGLESTVRLSPVVAEGIVLAGGGGGGGGATGTGGLGRGLS